MWSSPYFSFIFRSVSSGGFQATATTDGLSAVSEQYRQTSFSHKKLSNQFKEYPFPVQIYNMKGEKEKSLNTIRKNK